MKKFIMVLMLSLPLIGAGCKFVNYNTEILDKDGNVVQKKSVQYSGGIMQTSLGNLEIATPEGGKIILSDYKSDMNQLLMQTIRDAVGKIPSPSSAGSTTVINEAE